MGCNTYKYVREPSCFSSLLCATGFSVVDPVVEGKKEKEDGEGDVLL